MLRRILIGLFLFVFFLAGFAFFYYQSNQDALASIDPKVAAVFPVPRDVAAYDLIDANGDAVSTENWRGNWQLIYFGFTFCPDACPMALNDMRHVKKLLEDKNLPLEYTFVSVDPKRDTPERLKEYVSYFDKGIQAYTGQDEVLKALATNVGVVYLINDQQDKENYLVDHSTFFVLLNDQLQLKAVLRLPHDAQKIAAALAQIIQQ